MTTISSIERSMTVATTASDREDGGDTMAFVSQTLTDQIHFVSIVPDGKTKGKDFGTDAHRAIAWATQQSALGRNIYFTVNTVRPGVNKKPLKADMVGVRFAHVDVDPPRDGTPWDLQGALTALKGFDPPPSFVISSGNGLQGLWRLEGANLDEVEEINQALIIRFGGDTGTGNYDRLLRVPGFTNFPTKKKRDAGRVETMASLAERDTGTWTTAADIRLALDITHVPFEDCEPGKTETAKQAPPGEVTLLTALDCGSACKRNPVSGVIGVQ